MKIKIFLSDKQSGKQSGKKHKCTLFSGGKTGRAESRAEKNINVRYFPAEKQSGKKHYII